MDPVSFLLHAMDGLFWPGAKIKASMFWNDCWDFGYYISVILLLDTFAYFFLIWILYVCDFATFSYLDIIYMINFQKR